MPATAAQRSPREWGHQDDALGRLRAVDLPDGRLVEYVVDGVGRRVGKKVDGVLVKGWLYRDGLNPVAVLRCTPNGTTRCS